MILPDFLQKQRLHWSEASRSSVETLLRLFRYRRADKRGALASSSLCKHENAVGLCMSFCKAYHGLLVMRHSHLHFNMLSQVFSKHTIMLAHAIVRNLSSISRKLRVPVMPMSGSTRKCTLWRCKSTPTPKAKLLAMDDVTLWANCYTKCHGNTISHFHLIAYYVTGWIIRTELHMFCDTRRIPT